MSIERWSTFERGSKKAMPSDEQDQTSPQADRLSRKLDRMQTGQPSPVHDGDTEDLANLARLLMEHLDKEQPDPEFRHQLKQDLIAPGPRVVNLPRRTGPRRYPVPALFGALTIVLVASAVTGWMVWADHSDRPDDTVGNLARFASASPTAVSATGALVTASSLATLEPALARTRTSATIAEQGHPGGDPAPTNEQEAVEEAAQQPPSQIERAIVDLPPVDAQHVELGALATVAAPVGDSPAHLSFSHAIDPATVVLDQLAVAYQFSSPYVDAKFILRSVQEFLGIETEIEQRDRGGRTVYALSSPGGSVNFTWSPETGAFSCTLPAPYSTETVHELGDAAIEWLNEFGFPVDSAGARPVIQTNGDGQTFVHVPLGESQLPNPAVGHPMSITLVVDSENRIVSVSGYWIEVTDQSEVTLVTAEQAWQRLLSGGGYWPQGSDPHAAGEFVAEQFAVSYMLTSSKRPKKGLALQPVIAITGVFFPEDGSDSYTTTVYVQGMSDRS